MRVLLRGLIEARKPQYYNIDITSILSTPSLALKIFRSLHYMDRNPENWIPNLSKDKDLIFRDAYYGGSTVFINLNMILMSIKVKIYNTLMWILFILSLC